jgi:Rrf2 family iron-sulfur cluster assembly transcriptional regulator
VQIHEFLNGISLADLVAKRDTQKIAQRQIDQLLVLDDNLQAQAC